MPSAETSGDVLGAAHPYSTSTCEPEASRERLSTVHQPRLAPTYSVAHHEDRRDEGVAFLRLGLELSNARLELVARHLRR
jgi:hypothetical protein